MQYRKALRRSEVVEKDSTTIAMAAQEALAKLNAAVSRSVTISHTPRLPNGCPLGNYKDGIDQIVMLQLIVGSYKAMILG
jgi:hypothetical protein